MVGAQLNITTLYLAFWNVELGNIDHDTTDTLLNTLFVDDERVYQCRVWELYKAYPCIAQGNIS